MPRRIGYEGKVYTGTAGSTAATELTIVRSVTFNIDPDRADTSDRASFINSTGPAGVTVSIDIEMNNDNSNAFVATLLANATAGTLTALKLEDYSGNTVFDGDVVAGFNNDQPLRDAQRITTNCTPSNATRAPVFA